MRAAAAEGALRLGVLRIADQPVAAQIWIVAGARATIFKLAHRQDHKDLSPGSLLTEFMAQQIMEGGEIEQIDFGRGDDAYKGLWLSQRKQRAGVVSANRHTILGKMAAFSQLVGSGKRRLTPSPSIRYIAKQEQ